MTQSENNAELSRPSTGAIHVRTTGPGAFPEVMPGPGATSGPSPGRMPQLDHILRFRRMILIVFLAVGIPAIALIWTMIIPRYTARGEIIVRPIIPTLVFRTEDNGMIPLYESYKNTQVAIILGPTVLQRVLDNPEVQKTKWYRKAVAAMSAGQGLPMERLKTDLEVRPRGQTEIIDVLMTDRSATDAAGLVNTVLEEYIKFVRESTDKTKDLLYQRLVEEYESLRGEIEGQEKLIARLCKELGTGDPGDLVARQRLRLDEAEANLQVLDRQIALAVWQEKQLEELNRTTTKPTTASPQKDMRYHLDDEWRRIYLSLSTIQHEHQAALNQMGEDHPRLVELRGRIEFTQTQLRNREDQLEKEWSYGINVPPEFRSATIGFQADAEVQRQKIKQLQYDRELLFAAVEKQRASFEQTFNSAQMLAKETEGVKRKRELYHAIRTRLDEKELERKVPGSIEINARAMASSKPTGDRRLVLTLMALIGGLITAIAAGFLRVSLDRTILEVEELTGNTPAPFLGRLPLASNRQPHALENCPVQSEYIRMIRTALLQRLESPRGSVILITSAVPGEGKTTTAIMLARSLTGVGKKVLLVDADLRNPVLSRRFAAGAELSPLLVARGTVEWHQPIKTGTDGLSILPAEALGSGENPEIFSDGVFAEWMDRWQSEYDLILLDAPPVLPVADARILSRQVDGTILVVRERYCHRDDVKDALAYLSTAGARLFGTVFIGSERRNAYGHRHYQYYNYYSKHPSGNS